MAYDVEIHLGDHVLERGDVLKDDLVKGRIYGKENAPLIILPGGISASRFIADHPKSGPQTGSNWWPELVRAGGAIDLNHYQVLGLDLAPGGMNAQRHLTITTKDQAKRLGSLLDHLQIKKAHSIIGTSYGGMVALAFAADYPDRVGQMCLLGATHRPFPMGVGVRGIQRQIIDLATKYGEPSEGLKLARQLAMTTYRSAEEFSKRFKAVQTGTAPTRFDVGDYLAACGDQYPDVMPVERFMTLSQSIDLHAVNAGQITTPTLLIATNSDQLAPPSEVEALHKALGGPSKFMVIDSIYGHDSFLKEMQILAPLLSKFIKGAPCAA